MTWIFNLLLGLLPVGVRAYFGVKQDQAIAEGVDKEKANESTQAVANAADSQVISSDVSRMSDDSVRKSPYANNR